MRDGRQRGGNLAREVHFQSCKTLCQAILRLQTFWLEAQLLTCFAGPEIIMASTLAHGGPSTSETAHLLLPEATSVEDCLEALREQLYQVRKVYTGRIMYIWCPPSCARSLCVRRAKGVIQRLYLSKIVTFGIELIRSRCAIGPRCWVAHCAPRPCLSYVPRGQPASPSIVRVRICSTYVRCRCNN